ncbi:RNA polymerase factor sigma-54 [Xylocopilactobacillus apis]|uniref:RNA polymerase sigma-54 factor n=1 Tax=Xylocopilactobacillus apis TaxID=2932183 RepID=A0AAU9DB53_9LACO|nr:RNA polymerase factor sigma-54 [Xylocopilactobacillus apis]BDR56970.1 RNA polymerase sigma-54 factor [Xylocopilactobacillus apis]
MALKQSYQINQKQLHRLALTQSMKQSILILQTNLLDLTDYAQELSMANPLFDVNPTISKQEVEMSTAADIGSNEQQTVYSYLLDQVHLTMRDTPLRNVVLDLIDCLDEHGYLIFSDHELLNKLSINRITLMDAKELLYNLDPPGVGAQSLLECLSLQLQFKTATPGTTLALDILEHCYDELLDHKWDEIASNLNVSHDEVKSAFKIIQTLTPYPFTEDFNQNNYIIPELILKIDGDKLSLEVTKYGYPNIVFEKETYDELKKSTDQEVKSYLKLKYEEYQTLQRNLNRRVETIAMIGRCIVEAQAQFLMQKSKTLNPLLLRDVAQKLNINQSTVSRTINGKYLQTDFGVFELKYFFTKRSNPDSGQSVGQVQEKIKKLIDQEQKAHPLSDQKISEALAEQGIKIARRTVTKYREQLGINSASKRKTLE